VTSSSLVARALAGVALVALAAASLPAAAQTAAPEVVAQTTPLPVLTPIPSTQSGGTTSSNRSQSPSALPGAAGTPAPLAPGAPASPTVSGGYTAVNAAAIPTLAPADQAAPLPYPAYGTPAPISAPHLADGVPQIVTLQQAILIAYARSPVLAAARAAVAISTAPVELAQSALFPAVDGTISSTRSHDQLTGTSTGTTVGSGATPAPGTTTTTTTTPTASLSPNRTTNNLSISITQLIYDGGHVAAEIRSARATQNASIATYQRQLQTVAYNVATAYYNALSAQRQLQVDLATVQLDQVQEALVAAQIRAGTEARADLATAEFPTAQARVAVIRAQATVLTNLATFANTLGIDAAVNVQPKDDVPPLSATNGTIVLNPAFPTPSYDQAIARADLLRPDIASSKQTIVSYQENLRAARLGNFPTVHLDGDYGTASTDAGGGTFRNSGSLGLTLSIPFYDQGVTRAQVAQAQGQLDQAVANYQQAYQGVQLNVQQSVVNLISSYAALTQTNAELAQAQTVLKSTEAQYRAGVTTLPLLLNAQVGLTQALTDEVTAVYSVRQAEQSLLYAEGANAAG
jgi:outer membrane protein